MKIKYTKCNECTYFHRCDNHVGVSVFCTKCNSPLMEMSRDGTNKHCQDCGYKPDDDGGRRYIHTSMEIISNDATNRWCSKNRDVNKYRK